jgi:hypothetical protein
MGASLKRLQDYFESKKKRYSWEHDTAWKMGHYWFLWSSRELIHQKVEVEGMGGGTFIPRSWARMRRENSGDIRSLHFKYVFDSAIELASQPSNWLPF